MCVKLVADGQERLGNDVRIGSQSSPTTAGQDDGTHSANPFISGSNAIFTHSRCLLTPTKPLDGSAQSLGQGHLRLPIGTLSSTASRSQ